MNTPFIYDRFVTNRDFVGRKTECTALTNLIESNENVAIYAPPKSGKRSLIQQVLFNMRLAGKQFIVTSINMFNIRTPEDFLVKTGNAVIRSTVSSPQEYAEIASKYLSGTHFAFDRERLADNDEVISLEAAPDKEDYKAMFRLPGRISEAGPDRVIVVIEEFQSILAYENYDMILKAMEEVFAEMKSSDESKCNFIITGSKVNAMKFIFEQQKYFHRLVERFSLGRLNEKEVFDHLRRGFMQMGKELDREKALGACSLFHYNIWYLNHFSSICNSLAIGYINEGVMLDALNALISIHEPRLIATMGSLTDNQISFLKAVLDGVMKFSSADIIEKYDLHSSANVKRVKEALFKKEVVTSDENGDIVFLDPLFEYWVRSKYFEMQ
ncbi:MAG: hypothetical protein LUC24_04895 [Bacteroidales bacterium]|nr:hypothetical protein [Bacteroidales bacterium]